MLIMLMPIVAPATVSAAVADPDSITLHTAKVFQNIFEDSDMLFLVSYDVDYASEPSEDAIDTFQLSLYSAAEAEMQTRVLNYYQYNVHSIYFSATDAAALVWESSYKIRVMGNPAFFTPTEDTTMDTITLSSTDWISGNMSDSRELLRLHCLNLAQTLEDEWSLTLIIVTTDGQVLNSAGRITFLDAVPTLDTAVSNLFQVASSTVTVTQRDRVSTYEGELTLASKLGATIATAFEGIGTNVLNISGQKVAFLWISLFALIVISIVFLNSGNVTGAMILSIPVFIMGTLVGAIPLAILFIATSIVVVYTGYHIWLRGL